MIRPTVSRHSSSTSTRPLSSGFHRSETVRRPPGTSALFQAMPPKPGLPRERVLAAGVEVDVGQRREDVVGVGDVRPVQLLGVAHRDHPRGHPVGEHHDVLADVVAVGELALDLPVVGVVAVDVLAVGDVDARLLAERLERRVGVPVLGEVEVERPVGPGQRLVLVRAVLRRLERGAAAGTGARRAGGAARGEEGPEPEQTGALEGGAARDLRGRARAGLESGERAHLGRCGGEPGGALRRGTRPRVGRRVMGWSPSCPRGVGWDDACGWACGGVRVLVGLSRRRSSRA